MQSEYTLPSELEHSYSTAADVQRRFSQVNSQVNRLFELRKKPPIGEISLTATRSIIEFIGFSADGHDLNYPLSTPGQTDPLNKAVNLLMGSFDHPPVPNPDFSYAKEIYLLLPKGERMKDSQEILMNYGQICREIKQASQSGPIPKELKQRAAVSSLRVISLLGSKEEIPIALKNQIAPAVANIIRNYHLGEEIGEAIGMKFEGKPVPAVPAVKLPAPLYRRPAPSERIPVPAAPAVLQTIRPPTSPVSETVTPVNPSTLPKRKKSLSDKVSELIYRQKIPNEIKIKQRKRGKTTTVTEPVFPHYVKKDAGERLNPYEMKESELKLGEISIIRFDTPAYGGAEIMVDARGSGLDLSPTVIDTRGQRVKLKRVRTKDEKESGAGIYAICIRFDSYGRAKYFEDDGRRKYHAKVELTLTPDSGGVFYRKLSYFINKQINTAERTLEADDHLREIADLDYGFCQERNGLLSRFAFEKRQEDEAVMHLFTGNSGIDNPKRVHLFTGQAEIDNPERKKGSQDALLNKILIPSLPLDPTTFGMTILTDSGAQVIDPVNNSFHQILFPDAGRKAEARAKLAGIHLKSDELLFDILAVKDTKGQFFFFDGTRYPPETEAEVEKYVEIFVVRKKGSSAKNDRIFIFDRSLEERENPAPFQSGIRARKLKVGERLEFENREILLTPEAKIDVSFNQVFEVRLSERENDPLMSIHSPVIPGDKPQVSFYNAHLTRGEIEVRGRSKPIQEMITINHNNPGEVSSDVVGVLRPEVERILSLHPALPPEIRSALSRVRNQNRIFGFATTIDEKGEVIPAKIRGEVIKGRTFIFIPKSADNNSNNYLALQLDLPKGETFCDWNKAVATLLNPSHSRVVDRELVFISGTEAAPASCQIVFDDSLFLTPVVLAGKLRGREAIIEGVIDRQKTGKSLDLVDVTHGRRQAIRPAGIGLRAMDDDVRRILSQQDVSRAKLSMLSRSQVYLVGIRHGRRNYGFVDLSTDKNYLRHLIARKTENREAKILISSVVRAAKKILHIGAEYEGMSKIIILEDYKTKRRTYYLFDQSRSTFAESSFSAGLGVRIGSKDERSRITQIRDYQDRVAEENKKRRQKKRAKFARTLGLSVSLASMLGGSSLDSIQEKSVRRIPPQPVPIIYYTRTPDGYSLPVSTDTSEWYSPASGNNAFDFPSSRLVQLFTMNSDGTAGMRPAEGIVLSGGQVNLEGAGVAVSGLTDLNGKSVTLFASNLPVPYPIGGENKDHVLQPAVYTAFDIDGNLGYRNDKNDVKLLELKDGENKPILDAKGNPIRFTRTSLQSGLFAGATLYQAALPSGDIIFIDPADIENIYDGDYDSVPVFAAYSKATGKTYWYKTGENIQKPTHDLFTKQPVDQMTGTSFEEINMDDLFYEPLIFADKNGQIVARKDISMSLVLAQLNASIYQTDGDKPVVYRYYENGQQTDRFITIFQGRMEEVARIISPDNVSDNLKNSNTVIAYKKKIRIMPEQSRLQEFRQKFDAFLEEVWVMAEVLPEGTVAKNYNHLLVYDPENSAKVTGFYRYNVLPGIEVNGKVNPAGNIGYYKKYFRVEFKGISENYFVSEDQLNGKSSTAGGFIYGIPDTLGFTDIYGNPTAYLVDGSLDTLGVRSKDLHPPNIFIVEDQGRLIFRFDNKFYISDQNERFSYDFDHLPTSAELKNTLPEKVYSSFVSGDVESSENTSLTFQKWVDNFMKKLIPGVEARSNSPESVASGNQLTEFSAYIDQAITDAVGSKITSGTKLAEFINHQLIYYGLDETYLLGNHEYQKALQAIAGSTDSLEAGDSRIKNLKTSFVPFFQNDGVSSNFAGEDGFEEANNFNTNPSNLVYEARLPEGTLSYSLSLSVPVFDMQVPNADGSYTIQRMPGIAMVTYDSDGQIIGEYNPTNILGEFPVPMGSTIKPLEYAFFKYLELIGRPILIDGRPLDLHNTPVNYAPGQYSVDGSELPSNVVNAYDKLNSNAGDPRMTMDQALAVSANVPFQYVMRQFLEQNPDGWQEWQTFLGKLGTQMVDLQGNVLDKATPLAAIGSDVYVTNLKSMGLAFAVMVAPEKTLTDQAMITALQQARDTLMNDEIKLQSIGINNFMMDNIGIELLSSTIDGKEGVFGGKTGTVGGGANGTTHVLSMGFVKMPNGKFVVAVAIEAGQTIGSDGSSHPTDLLQVIQGPYGSTMVMPWLRMYLTRIYQESMTIKENSGVSQDINMAQLVDTVIQKLEKKGYESLIPREVMHVFSSPQQQFVYDLSVTINRLLDEQVTDKNDFRIKLKQSLVEKYKDMVDSPEFNAALDIFIADMYGVPGQPVQCMDFLFLVQDVFGTGVDSLPKLSGQTREMPDAQGSIRADSANDLIDTEFAGITFVRGSDTPTELYFHNNKEIRITKLAQIQEGDFIIVQDSRAGHIAYAVKTMVGQDGKPMMILAQSNKEVTQEGSSETGRPDIIVVNDQNFEQLVGKFGNVFVLRNPKFVPPQSTVSGKKAPAKGPLGTVFPFPSLGMIVAQGKGKRKKPKNGNKKLTYEKVFHPTDVDPEAFARREHEMTHPPYQKFGSKGQKKSGGKPAGNFEKTTKPKGFQPGLRNNR